MGRWRTPEASSARCCSRSQSRRAAKIPRPNDNVLVGVRGTSQANPLEVLVPSPLVGPGSWMHLQQALASMGVDAVASVDLPDAARPMAYWERTVGGVERTLRQVPADRAVVLVGYSGAGALLPAIGRAIIQRVAAYLFLDAGLPAGGRTRLDTMAAEGPDGAAFAIELASALEAGHRYPEWTDEDLAPLVPDPERRHQVLAEVQPRGRAFWTEPLPIVEPWPDAPCGFLQFSEAYQFAADEARSLGWPVRHLPGSHFQHLVDERAVAQALRALLADLGRTTS
jgi:hypothetical protein